MSKAEYTGLPILVGIKTYCILRFLYIMSRNMQYYLGYPLESFVSRGACGSNTYINIKGLYPVDVCLELL